MRRSHGVSGDKTSTDYFKVESIGSHWVVLKLKMTRCLRLLLTTSVDCDDRLICVEVGTAPIDCKVPMPSPFLEPSERRKSIIQLESDCIIWKRFQHNWFCLDDIDYDPDQLGKSITVRHLNANSKYSLRLCFANNFTTDSIQIWTTDSSLDDKHQTKVDEDVDFDAFYQSGRRLGSGQFGDVFLCCPKHSRHQNALEMYAVKQVKLIRKDNKESVKMEVEILSQIRHPNIVWLKHVIWQSKQWAYLILELLSLISN